MNKYVILPGCDDGNRGDQALVWETVKIAKQSGFDGKYYMLCAPEDMLHSTKEDIQGLSPILAHPGRKSSGIDNQKYGLKLILSWGMVAAKDYIMSKLILWKFTRSLLLKYLSPEIRNTVKIIQDCDACFVKGGGFLHSYGSLTEIYQIYFFLYHILLAQSLGKKVYIMPNSFGPFIAPTVKYQVRKALKKCELVLSRESISQKMLEEIGVPNLLYPDLAFGLKKRVGDACVDELKNLKLKQNRALVGITVRPYRFPGSSCPENDYKNYIDAFTNMGRWLYENNYFPVFIEHVVSKGKHESDIECIKTVTENLNPSQYAVISNPEYDCRDMKYIYSQMDLVIGTRFHSVIFTLSEGIPCIAVAYGGNKGLGIMNDLSLDNYVLKIEDISFEKLKDIFNLIIKNESGYKNEIKNQIDLINMRLNQIPDLIKS